MSTQELPSLLLQDFEKLSQSQIIKRTKFCEKIYKELLIFLSNYLNKLHNQEYSIKSWEIIIGFWLKDYIYFSFKSFTNLKYLIKKKNISRLVLTKKKYFFQIDSSFSFNRYTEDADFNIFFYSKVAKFFYKNKIYFKNFFFYNYPLKTKINNFSFNNFSFINFTKKYLKNIFNFSFKKRNFFMSHTYLPLLEEKKLGLKLGDVLSNYLEPKVEYSKYNYSLRKFIYLKINKKKNIRNFIIQNLNFFIPKSYIEDFALIKSLSNKNKHYPPNPKFIFTSNLYATDEVFKIYAASKVQEKTKYIIGQHGNNYFTKIYTNYLPEINTCDIFFSWGFKKKPKIINTFNFKVLGKNFKKKKKTKFLIVLHHFKEINPDIASNSLLKYFDFKNLLKALKKLKPEIRKHTTIRMPKYLPNKFNINFSKYLNKLDIEIDNGNDNLDEVMKETKLCLFNYDSTGFLENTLIDVPSLILENKFYLNSINKSYLPRYKKLCSNKIMFTDPEKVVSHINLNWDNIELWWSKNKIKDTINFFNKNLNISPTDKNCTKQLLKYLKKIN